MLWLNSALCGGNGKTSVLKQWVIEQMGCGRVGWIKDDAVAGMQAGESLVNMLTPMAFEVALMTALWLAYMEASMVAPMASMVAPMASMVASMVSRRSKEEITAKDVREGTKSKYQNERRSHESKMALMVTSLASMASRALMVAAIVLLEWLYVMVAELKRNDKRAGRLTPRCEEILTWALELILMVTEWMAPMTPLVTSMASIASMDSMVASMDLFTVWLASMASMVASLVWLRLMTEQRTGGKRGDGLIQKICDERADELPHKMGEEGADELTHKSDGERVERLTYKIREERADGLTHKSCEERADGLTIKIDGERAERWTHKIRGEQADGLTHKSGEE